MQAGYLIMILLLISPCFQIAVADNFNHTTWDELLHSHVVSTKGGAATAVNYDGMAKERSKLKQYLNRLSAVEKSRFDQWPTQDQLAFLINAYNAWTVELILTAWPNIKSIKELGNFLITPWRKRFVPLLGEKRSLDDIEHRLIRGSDRYKDPRIHFAVNCASIGCPALRAEAFTGPKLNEQLDEQTNLFLSDRSRNRVEDKTIYLSSIFDWYEEDFEKGWLGYQSLDEFIIKHATALELSDPLLLAFKSGDVEIDFLDYDWRLNSSFK